MEFEDAPAASAAPRRAEANPAPAAPAPGTANVIHKGFKLAEVAAIWGEPTSSSAVEENGMKMTKNTYKKGARTLEATFVEGVLVRYSITEDWAPPRRARTDGSPFPRSLLAGDAEPAGRLARALRFLRQYLRVRVTNRAPVGPTRRQTGSAESEERSINSSPGPTR